jgi:hypothetical protein
MRFDPEIYDKEVEREFRWFFRWTGEQALLGCLIEEIEDEDWKTLQGGTGLQAVAARLLESPLRRHINLLAFSSDRTPPKQEENTVTFAATHLDFWHREPRYELPKSFLFGF